MVGCLMHMRVAAVASASHDGEIVLMAHSASFETRVVEVD